jgi:hypothetical protein
MTQQHPIVPPPELVKQWIKEFSQPNDPRWQEYEQDIATCAAQWGADQELEACVAWLDGFDREGWAAEQLRSARRPKPPSLKELALETLLSMQIQPCVINGINTNADLMAKYDILRRALESIPDHTSQEV